MYTHVPQQECDVHSPPANGQVTLDPDCSLNPYRPALKLITCPGPLHTMPGAVHTVPARVYGVHALAPDSRYLCFCRCCC